MRSVLSFSYFTHKDVRKEIKVTCLESCNLVDNSPRNSTLLSTMADSQTSSYWPVNMFGMTYYFFFTLLLTSASRSISHLLYFFPIPQLTSCMLLSSPLCVQGLYQRYPLLVLPHADLPPTYPALFTLAVSSALLLWSHMISKNFLAMLLKIIFLLSGIL